MVTHDVHGLGEFSPRWLADQLDDRGLVRLQDVFSAEWLDAMRTMVVDYIAANGDRDFYLDRADQEVGSPAHRLTSDPAVRRLFAETANLRRPHVDSADAPMRCSMLVRTGTVRKAPSHLFHYDPCVLTMIVPIFIPQGPLGTCGELAAFGNTRPFRRFHATHLADVLLTHNRWYRRHTTKRVHDAPEKYVVPLQPGDAYLFWGYRTYHGNLGCAPGVLRTTLVLKFGAVHPADGWLSKVAWRFSRSRRDMQRFQGRSALPRRAADDVASPSREVPVARR
ncbi:hypothetical protein [Mycolicibacterium madagascariense]|nr:hypothetical protein [Mycolicibacterium madagascariense]